MPVVRVIWRYTVASLAAGVAAYAVLAHSAWLLRLDGTGGAALRIACVTVLFGALYLVAVIVLHRGPKPLRTMITLIGELRGKTPPAASSVAGAELVPSVE
jgi:hypothetical protein